MNYLNSQIYYISPPPPGINQINLSLQESHHLLQVKKTPRNSIFYATDGLGNLYKLKLTGVNNLQAQAEILNITNQHQELPFELNLISAIPSRKRIEFLVEKATELGINHFFPLIAQRQKKVNVNLERLNNIALSAVKQCGRTVMPLIHPPQDLQKILSFFPANTAFTVMDIRSSNCSAQGSLSSTTLLIGPEGGWSEKEREIFNVYPAEFIQFGATTLRTETAALVGLTLIIKENYEKYISSNRNQT